MTYWSLGAGTMPTGFGINFARLDATATGFTFTLPDATAMSGGAIGVIKIDSSANVVTIGRTSSQTINGAASNDTLSTQWACHLYVSDGTNWLRFV